jgi:hypothetical protein
LEVTFFGLSDRYVEVMYEEMFQLKYHGGWSFFESYNLPVNIRNWFLERLIKEKEDEAEAMRSTGGSGRSGRGKSYTP